MNREEKIMKRLQEHYDYVESLGHNVVAIFVQGSNNYNLDIYSDEYMSDVDSKSIVLPTLDDLVVGNKMVSTTYDVQGEHSVEHAEVKDIRIMMDMWVKENPSYLELLFTDFKIINPLYKEFIDEILAMNNEIVKINIPQLLKCINGMSMEKLKAMEHPYPSIIDKIEKYHYDGKQVHHIVRLNYFLKDMVNNNFNFKFSMQNIESHKNFLIDIKLNKPSLDEARIIAKQYDDNTRDYKNYLLENKFKDYKFQDNTYNKLKDIVCRCVKFNIIQSVRDDFIETK